MNSLKAISFLTQDCQDLQCPTPKHKQCTAMQAKHLGQQALCPPLFPIEPMRWLIDPLHELLNIIDKLFVELIWKPACYDQRLLDQLHVTMEALKLAPPKLDAQPRNTAPKAPQEVSNLGLPSLPSNFWPRGAEPLRQLPVLPWRRPWQAGSAVRSGACPDTQGRMLTRPVSPCPPARALSPACTAVSRASAPCTASGPTPSPSQQPLQPLQLPLQPPPASTAA